MPIAIEKLGPMEKVPGNEYINPYNQDLMRMGVPVSRNIEIMGTNLFHNHDIDWFIIVNKRTGERIKVVLQPHEWNIYEPVGEVIFIQEGFGKEAI